MTINGDGTVDFTLTANANGTDTVQFRRTDAEAATADSNEVTVTVTAQNDTPTASAGDDVTITEDDESTTLSGSGTDLDNDTLTYSWTENIAQGDPDPEDACSLTNANTATPTISIQDRESTYNCSYQLIVNDGTVDSVADYAIVYVTADNDAPEFADIETNLEIDEGDTLVVSTSAEDQDTTTLSFTAASDDLANANNLLTDNQNNTATLTWTPGQEDAGTYDITFQVTDNENTVNQNIVIIVVDVESEEQVEDIEVGDIQSLVSRKKGKGNVKIVRKNGETHCTIRAFPKGGAIAKLVKLQETDYVSVVKNKSGSTIHIYDLNCQIVEKKRLSPKLHPRRMATANFAGNKVSDEIAVSARRNGGIHVKIYRYVVSTDTWKLKRYQRFGKVPARYILKVTTKNNILIKRKTDGKKLHKWKIK